MLLRNAIVSLGRLFGIDQAIAFTVLARVWSGVVTIVTVSLIAKFLTPAEQGYYYSFSSLVALQVVFELGFSFVVLQMASHERAHLDISNDQSVSGDLRAHSRLASVLQKSVRWYGVAGVLMMVVLMPIGVHFFGAHTPPGELVAWRLPWYCVVLANTLTFQIDPFFSFLEGCGYVSRVAETRFYQSILGGGLAWAVLLLHHGLYAPAMMILGQALAGSTLLWRHRKLITKLLMHAVGQMGVRWGSEVWPFQWRIGLSWLSGYFMFQLFSPVLFAYWGPVAAGQMGMSLTVCNGLTTLAYAWISTKAAPFGMMIARKEFAALDQVFFHALRQAVSIVIAGAIIVWTTVLYLNHLQLRFSHRLLPPSVLALLLGAIIVNTIVFSEALYLRAHKEEKFLIVSVLSALATSASAYFLGKPYGAKGLAIGYLLTSVVIGLGLGSFTFIKYRSLWHRSPVTVSSVNNV